MSSNVNIYVLGVLMWVAALLCPGSVAKNTEINEQYFFPLHISELEVRIGRQYWPVKHNALTHRLPAISR